jgi:uncharacterized repeat protein (TIGR04076 family)
MLSEETKAMVMGATGLSEDEIVKLHPGMQKLLRSIGKTPPVQIVAEVIKSDHCSAQIKKGDRLVFDPYLNPEKSSCVMCARALLPVLIQVNAIGEMNVERVESGKTDLPEIVFRNVRCLDPGIENGGVGGVVFNIRQEEIVT